MKGRSSLELVLENLGAVFRVERQRLGISQEELAHRSGLHRTYITEVERGARNLTIDSLIKLSNALDLGLSHVLTRVDDRLGLPFFPSSHQHLRRFPPQLPATILVVEDDPKDAELTILGLERHGVVNTITIARSGSDALSKLFPEQPGQYVPDLVLLDLRLQDIDGLEILRRMRADDRTRRVPVAVLTSSRSDEDYRQCIELGVSCFISKPVEFLEFSSLISTVGFRWMILGPR